MINVWRDAYVYPNGTLYNVSHHYTGPHKSVQFLCNSEIFLNAGKKKDKKAFLTDSPEL